MTKRKQIDFLLDLNQEIREKYRSERRNNRQLRRDIDEILDENERISDKCRALYKELEEVRQKSAETAKERDELKNRADFLTRANKAIKTPDEGGEKHGKWLNFYGDYSTAECSVCGEVYDAIQPREYNNPEHWEIFLREYQYCPNCGARMDGVEKK